MATGIAFKKDLCEICLETYQLADLHAISDKHARVCTSCVEIIQRKGDELLAGGVDEPTVPQHLVTVLRAEREELVSSVRSFLVFTNIRELLGAFIRVGIYILFFVLIDPESPAFAMIQGGISGDMATWVLLTFVGLPFRGLAVAFEFLLYGGLLSIYCINEQQALVLPEDGELMAMALLTFFAIAFAKIGWWAMKTFVLDESSD